MPKRQPSAQFELRFESRKVFPEDIALTTLATALEAVQRLALAESAEAEVDGLSIRLLNISRGSAAFRLVTGDIALVSRNLDRAAEVVSNCDVSEETAYAVRPIRELSQIAGRLGCPIALRAADKDGRVILQIEPETYRLLSASALSKGDATTTAYVLRIGGAGEPKCMVRIPGHSRVLFCRLATEQLARKLAPHLYRHVVVSGTAIWLRHSQKIIRLRVSSFRPFPRGTLTEAFAQIRDAGGAAWDRVEDPGEHLSKLTGD